MSFKLAEKRGQAAIEFMLVITVVISIVVGVLLPLFGESELSTAIASARIGVLQETSSNSSSFLSSIDYSIVGTKVILVPSVYNLGVKITNTDVIRLRALKKIASTFSPSKQPASSSSCVNALYYTYCVS